MLSTRLLSLPVARLLLVCTLGYLPASTAIWKSFVGSSSHRLKPPTDVAGRLLDKNGPFDDLKETARFEEEVMKPNPLNDVILLLGHPRADRAQFLLGYSTYFYDVWYIKSSDKQNALGEGCAGSEDMRCVSDKIPKIGKIVESLIQQTQRDATSINGLMYLHFDFFLNPAVLATHPLDLVKVWRPRRGLERYGVILDNKCLKGQELLDSHEGRDEEHWKNGDGSGGWFPAPCPAPESKPGWCHMKPDLMAIVKQITLNKLLGSARWEPDELCYGSADIFYLPVAGFAAYKTLSESFANGWHESAVPTMLAMIVRSKQVPGEEVLDCWCCQDCSANRSVIFSNLCGHRVDLSRAENQVAMVDMLAGQSDVGALLLRKAHEINHVGAVKDFERPALNRKTQDADGLDVDMLAGQSIRKAYEINHVGAVQDVARPALNRKTQDADGLDVEGAAGDFKNPAAFGRLQARSAVRRELEAVDRFPEGVGIGDLHVVRTVS